jgi:hypothetical protein
MDEGGFEQEETEATEMDLTLCLLWCLLVESADRKEETTLSPEKVTKLTTDYSDFEQEQTENTETCSILCLLRYLLLNSGPNVSRAAIPKRDAAHTNGTAPGVRNPLPTSGNTPLPPPPKTLITCGFLVGRMCAPRQRPPLARQLRWAVPVAFRCANSWAVPLGKK